MGHDDRDYMRDRRRAEREAARLGSASWVDRKGRLHRIAMRICVCRARFR